jgi:hypothetical protein
MPLEHGLEIVGVDAVGMLLDAGQRRLHVAERGDRAGVAGQLQQHHVAGIEQRPRDEIEPLLRSSGHQQILERRDDAARGEQFDERFEQRAQAVRRPVLQQSGIAFGQQPIRDGPIVVPRKAVGTGIARRERDQIGALRGNRAHLPDRRLLHRLRGTRQKGVVVHIHGCPR